MLQIMLTCVRTGEFVPTGIATDIETFAALPDVPARIDCPACGCTHYWTKGETWICEAEGGSRSALPAEIYLRH